MAFIWVQQYFTLPVIFEGLGMGDEPPLPAISTPHENEESLREHSPQRPVPVSTTPSARVPDMEFESYPRQHFGMAHFPGAEALDMSNMAAALPEYPMRQFQQQPFPHQFPTAGSANQSIMYQYQQGAQFAGQTAGNYSQTFAQQYPTQYVQSLPSRQGQGAFPQFIGGSAGVSGPQAYPSQALLLQQSMLQSAGATVQHQQHQHQQHHQSPFAQSHVPAPYMGHYPGRVAPQYPLPHLRVNSSLAHPQAQQFYQQLDPQAIRRTSSNSSLQTSALRGPPRKPRQSGHALWVGNLPPSTNIIDLKDHFSKDATEDIESVFLISKSNCAFVNYKTEASCAAAMTRFHDSRFQGVRLVCRLRRGSSSAANTPQSVDAAPAEISASAGAKQPDGVPGEQAVTVDGAVTAEPEPMKKVKEKFFVVKSLTVEDLERSVVSGIWATQAHNEEALNKAYQTAENVYLIFSANKSGEYFGYARMESAIDAESAAKLDYQPRPEAPNPSPSDVPLTVYTPATATAPRGRIIDDSARGTIFWEADVENREKEEQHTAEEDSGNLSGEGYESTSPATPQSFGKPFKIKWMSTDRLPFYRTRGLRNPWNSNREVKIARDGTEIEPSVGRRLVSMFHRPQMAAPVSPSAARQHPPAPQGPPPPMAGFMSPPHGAAGAAPGGMYGRGY
ncbi:hypothetical protein HRR88_001153 [Exophiala dermatitidis]|nr:hypothetical protein HRR82_007509 [Exophiala dermatitidis]KAJ4578432.1 hypothetical protein HRR79_001735 [Exophiala dermatitidis]KAJ4631606.1 hypothetical protein HRR88_001153 [Exophiala dermatitidis]KAJ4639477.1 hypothetical protein HRR89_004795 [Exophiala dermatitidis]KAJ4654408.1 hypothetical protein HRR91_003900 [Exophiala dermatitidis]